MNIGRETFAIEADMVVGIVETSRLHLLPFIQAAFPSEKGRFIKGVITQRGEVIIVIGLENLFGLPSTQEERPYRVAVIKKDAANLGIYVGKKKLSFLWKEELANLEVKPSNENYTLGFIDPSGKRIRLLDWQNILEETQKLLGGRM
ncbi:MAG: chemotaxis protein CheW [Deltaproteobacteria bacterium]|nr:chemotaxis protein CheW [Deltaproteobacteria bacterium]MBI3756189.1 chemotaxis protein CheW [Deltaproteobacteria bacterium]